MGQVCQRAGRPPAGGGCHTPGLAREGRTKLLPACLPTQPTAVPLPPAQACLTCLCLPRAARPCPSPPAGLPERRAPHCGDQERPGGGLQRKDAVHGCGPTAGLRGNLGAGAAGLLCPRPPSRICVPPAPSTLLRLAPPPPYHPTCPCSCLQYRHGGPAGCARGGAAAAVVRQGGSCAEEQYVLLGCCVARLHGGALPGCTWQAACQAAGTPPAVHGLTAVAVLRLCRYDSGGATMVAEALSRPSGGRNDRRITLAQVGGRRQPLTAGWCRCGSSRLPVVCRAMAPPCRLLPVQIKDEGLGLGEKPDWVLVSSCSPPPPPPPVLVLPCRLPALQAGPRRSLLAVRHLPIADWVCRGCCGWCVCAWRHHRCLVPSPSCATKTCFTPPAPTSWPRGGSATRSSKTTRTAPGKRPRGAPPAPPLHLLPCALMFHASAAHSLRGSFPRPPPSCPATPAPRDTHPPPAGPVSGATATLSLSTDTCSTSRWGWVGVGVGWGRQPAAQVHRGGPVCSLPLPQAAPRAA